MFFKSAAQRNEFAEPPLQDQSSVVLVLSDQRLVCRLIEVSMGGFSVMIPRATFLKGEPVGRLVTHDSSYKVRVLKQEARYEGFEVQLQRIDESSVEALPGPQRWIVHGSRCCAIGLILAIVYCFLASPGGSTGSPARAVNLRDLVNYWSDAWIASREPAKDKNAETADLPSIEIALEGDLESNAVAVSSVTRETAPAQALDRNELLRAALTLADSKRSRPLNASTLPWLFSKGIKRTNTLPRCRMAVPAESDLRVFEAGLNGLSASEATDAIQSLSEAIAAIWTVPASTVSGFPTLRVIRSEDAAIYFRVVDGEVELLRILPVEMQDASPLRSPSASVPHQVWHR